ncbi:flavin reductase [Bradyrhizobium sp. U87765 SZCCT0131]|uniref:flavin reductase family protein n=1 Tax=unclassified Bradyrhizobium TaxID=2631580 RepID=UPI001BAD0301|nr:MULTISPECIES: flavin reductase family protein [unclassified Bradyrhizobium]MBR1217521.1 flavin reductase [Bradyrhizobium sp. U87765 SZCCT0131]MBR1264881.1 flavin reductase [Bradyrhizobium sp. U87765 SZCCT0134]MBR1304863.1 flavin reductase [Bradyrhizobium sp. U87765 SZCCT0110]MBR1320650.1 flavin reductase [Bradyrhizobium sp. U87765 SZCCT0109]MBR1349070.1 flavin reductase [Bradyrhizobium sp. U87765 SZCCT0048]
MTAEHKQSEFRRLIGRFATGVAVVLTGDGGQPEGLTVNSLTSLSLDPLLLLFCARNESRSAAAVVRNGRFSVNVLAATQQDVSGHFAGRRMARPVPIEHHGGWIALADANASFLCHVERVHPGGDHAIIVGRVMHILGPECADQPLLYYAGGYARLPAPAVSG